MNRNICIVHFNTPVLTSHLVKSVNKYVPGARIFIFDNSDEKPFVNTFDNVKMFDNTKGQIINFDKWLEKYPNKKNAGNTPVLNKWASAKHCYSIEKCIELINENFVLLDSDILLTRNIDEFFDDRFIFVGKQEKRPGLPIRLLPYLCFINVEMMKKNNIHYFDEKMMNGLMVTREGNTYDTGAAFVVNTKKFPHKSVDIDKYMKHYIGASWQNRSRITTPENWLNDNKKYWEPVKKDDTKILVSLTSYKERMEILPKVFDCILGQTKKPDKIVLTIFKDDEKYLPDKVKNYFKVKKVELLIADENIKPHLKYFYVMKKYRDYAIITIDDDMIYPKDLVETLYNSYKKNQNVISARRVHRIKKDKSGNILPYDKWEYECKTVKTPSKELFATGVGGVLYPPDILKVNDSYLEDIHKIITADDVYLKYIENKLNISVLWVPNKALMGKEIKTGGTQKKALNKVNVIGKKNDEYIQEFLVKKIKQGIMETFNKHFSHIYCLHHLPSTDKLQALKDEMKRVGINPDDKKFSWSYDYPSRLLGTDKAQLNEYEAIKEAYALKYNRILVIKDGIKFYNDTERLNDLILNMPDSDIVLFDKAINNSAGDGLKYKSHINKNASGKKYDNVVNCPVPFVSSSCYSLDRKGMEKFIDRFEKSNCDIVEILKDNSITASFSTSNVAIQTGKEEVYKRMGIDVSKYGLVQQKPAQIKTKQVSVKHVEKLKTLVHVKKVELKEKKSVVKQSNTQTSALERLRKKRELKKTSNYNRLYDVM